MHSHNVCRLFLARFDKEADETDSSADDDEDGKDEFPLETSNLECG